MVTHEQRAARLRQYIDEDRLLRYAWTDDSDGRHRACLLAALAPECGEARSASACPADVMPPWLAHLTLEIDDRGSEEAWPAMVRWYAACAARWHVLDAAAWERVRVAHLLECLIIAREAVTEDRWGVLAALDEVVRLLREGGTEQEWAAARAAAWAAAEAARAARAAAEAAAWDRITDHLLSTIEAELIADAGDP